MSKSFQFSCKDYTVCFLQQPTSKSGMNCVRAIKNVFSYCLYIHNVPSKKLCGLCGLCVRHNNPTDFYLTRSSHFPRRYLWRLTIRLANALAFVSITESDIHISFLKETTNSALLTFYLLLLTFL